MGYTHYWRMSSDIPTEAWAQIAADAKVLTQASTTPLAFEEGEQAPPQIDGDIIMFNAASEDESCETFALTRARQDFEFCKTRGLGYDTAVCGILAVAAEVAPEAIKVSSDGDERDWSEPLTWASGVLGRAVPLPFGKDS